MQSEIAKIIKKGVGRHHKFLLIEEVQQILRFIYDVIHWRSTFSSYATLKNWIASFKRGNFSVQDEDQEDHFLNYNLCYLHRSYFRSRQVRLIFLSYFSFNDLLNSYALLPVSKFSKNLVKKFTWLNIFLENKPSNNDRRFLKDIRSLDIQNISVKDRQFY